MEAIQMLGFLPLLESGINGYSAEDMVAPECKYKALPDGGWDWPLWRWKGPVIAEMGCLYGKFFGTKAGFVSKDWWPDFCNWRRASWPMPDPESEPGAVQAAILDTLRERGGMVSRQLRTACGMVGRGMRSRFDGNVARLQMACRVVTEDFVYPRDRNGQEYGWGLALLTIPERLVGEVDCKRTPEQSYRRMAEHLHTILPHASEKQLEKLLR